MRGARKLEMRQRRWEALLGASKHKPLACKEGSGRGLRLGGRQLLHRSRGALEGVHPGTPHAGWNEGEVCFREQPPL